MLFNMVYLKVNSVYFCLGIRSIHRAETIQSQFILFITNTWLKRLADRPTPSNINAKLVCLKFLQEKQFSL